jgi:hypothetical protein
VETEKERNQKRDPGHDARERGHDKTIADSFPTSDPPSTIPNPVPESPGSAIDDDKKLRKK